VFKIESINDLHTVSRYKERLNEVYHFFQNLNVADPKDLPQVRAHLRTMADLAYDLQGAINKFKEGIDERTERQRRLKEERRRK